MFSNAFSILIGNNVTAMTPRYFGVNVEVQEHYENSNLWDWLMDSGAGVIREFHPEKYLRKTSMDPKTVADIHSKSDFDNWRSKLAATPEILPWGSYMFNEPVKWLGVPDGIIKKVKEGMMEPIISMGYYPRMFPEPLLFRLSADDVVPPAASYQETSAESPLKVGDWENMPSDDEINWRAAASAYEYYFAFIYHFSKNFGVNYFNLHNEPEFYYPNFHFPPELMPDPPRFHQNYPPRANRSSYYVPIAMQMAVLSRIARLALDDVRSVLPDPDHADRLTLAGPAWSKGWEYYWQLAHPYVDICDCHHYTTNSKDLEQGHHRLSIRLRNTSKKRTACTEYGRRGGPINVGDILFDINPALEAAELMMSALSLAGHDDPPCEFVTFYHFKFPATHRNYKCLLYGDMNSLDWSGQDKPLRDRGDHCYPSFDELQLRYPTTAYHIFRMLSRCAPKNEKSATSFAVMDVGFHPRNPKCSSLRVLAVDTGRDLVINILNRTKEQFPVVELDLGLLPNKYKFALIRETSKSKADELVSQLPIKDGLIHLPISSQSMNQIILTPLNLEQVSSLRIVEKSITPGSASGLALHQTTIFRTLGTIDGCEYDLTNMNIIWSSSNKEALPVYQGGLAVCMKPISDSVRIQAEIYDHSLKCAVECKII